ncbi:SAP30-binding protein isoform X1 [Lutzomyia longipalpis]|uniref:SAP30-binding protein isoform X1 n=1 Tax=Lutzomyia longipalpis TaxID=7200 RepID=UPI00248345A7|nr:SAP30-binding protein isoform X1 [Lutzomyia longipalpis]XP_055679947.1 SAP30-binding protein isoform X1 [Lutzomyia longipalpis]
MSAKNSALASLTANYTDSENEDHPDDYSPVSEGSTKQTPNQATKSAAGTPHPVSREVSATPPFVGTQTKPQPPKKALRLVSYNDEAQISDEENVSPNSDISAMDISEEEDQVVDKEQQESKTDKFAEYGFQLPPEPKGKCAPELQEKINNLYEKMKNNNMDMNKVIQERKEFRNPSIYEKLIQFCDINELGTNYPPEIYDPLQWGKESFYEELAKAQKAEMDKREKEKKDNAKMEQVAAAARKAEEEAKKRKSKWDQPGPSANSAALKPAGLVQPSLTTNITGTKGTVISAFGSLPKKPKI